MVVPSFIASFLKPFQGTIDIQDDDAIEKKEKHSATMLFLGLGAIVFVPIFKTATHLPPYVGMMLSLAVVATFAEIFRNQNGKLQKIDFCDCDGLHESALKLCLDKNPLL